MKDIQYLIKYAGFEDFPSDRYGSLQTNQEKLAFIDDLRREIVDEISSNDMQIHDLEDENTRLEDLQRDLDLHRKALRIKLGIDPVPGQLPLRLPKESDYESA